jgi:hypothetical protein
MKKVEMNFSTPYEVTERKLFEKHKETWDGVVAMTEDFIEHLERTKAKRNVSSLRNEINETYSSLHYLQLSMDSAVREVCDDIFNIDNFIVEDDDFRCDSYPGFDARKEKIPGTEDVFFHFVVPFAGHKKSVYHPQYLISMARYFSLGMDDLKKRMRDAGSEMDGFNYSFIGFLHHIHTGPNGACYDLDNIETKRVIDAVNGGSALKF